MQHVAGGPSAGRFVPTARCSAIRRRRRSPASIGLTALATELRLRSGRRRRWPGRSLDRSLRRVRGPVGSRARCACLRRPGRRQRPHRELPRLSDRNIRSGARGRAFVQAQKFGADIMIPVAAKTLDCARADGALGARDWRAANARGSHGRRGERRPLSPPGDPRHRALRRSRRLVLGVADRGKLVRWRGSRSRRRGQFGGPGRRLSLGACVEGSNDGARLGLAESMSRYLIDRIAATSNIELHDGNGNRCSRRPAGWGVEKVRWRNRRSGAETEAPIRNVFLFIGADPATEWLQGCGVAVDKSGFVTTGSRDR